MDFGSEYSRYQVMQLDIHTGSIEKLLDINLPERRQFPVYTPDGKFIFLTREGPDSRCNDGSGGCPQGTIALLDLSTKTERVINVPFKQFVAWIDNDTALILAGEYQGPWSLQKLNIRNSQTETLVENLLLF